MSEEIINGVNVFECQYYNGVLGEQGYCDIDQEHLYLCSSDENCYFKQLKRLEQENKELKRENEQLKKPCLVIPKVNQLAVPIDEYKKLYKALEEIKDIAQIHQYFNPELLEIKGDIGRIQDLKMTEIFKKCNEVLNDRD